MKKNIKWFAIGVCATLVLTNLSSAYSESLEKMITAVYDNIKIVVDGNEIIPKDVNGHKVEPFTYNDTAYLPVRAVSEAFGKNVSWDEDTKTIYIGENIPAEEITVSNAQELVSAIGSNKKIILKDGVYDFSSLSKVSESDFYIWKSVYDGYELYISEVSNLTIEGPKDGTAEIITDARYANIMSFIDCNNIAIRNIKAGHAPQKYECDAGVLDFTRCENITLDNDYLYGCGSMGVSAMQCKMMNIDSCTITDCSLRGMDISNSSDVFVNKSKITKNRAFSNIFLIQSSRNIKFTECIIEDNNYLEWGLSQANASSVIFDSCTFDNNSYPENCSDVCMFLTDEGKTTVRNCVIKNNKFINVTDNNSTAFDNCTYENNSFYTL